MIAMKPTTMLQDTFIRSLDQSLFKDGMSAKRLGDFHKPKHILLKKNSPYHTNKKGICGRVGIQLYIEEILLSQRQ